MITPGPLRAPLTMIVYGTFPEACQALFGSPTGGDGSVDYNHKSSLPFKHQAAAKNRDGLTNGLKYLLLRAPKGCAAIRDALSLRGAAEAISPRFLASLGMTFQSDCAACPEQRQGVSLLAMTIPISVLASLPSGIKAGELYEESFGLPDDDLTARSDLCSNATVWRYLCASVRGFPLGVVRRRDGRGWGYTVPMVCAASAVGRDPSMRRPLRAYRC